MAKNKKKSYGAQVAATAPAFAVKALLGDFPKGGIEKAVETKIVDRKSSAKNALFQGLKGRGAGRALGAGLGIATAPLFISGLKKLQKPSQSEKIKGISMIGASTVAYQSTKGMIEGYREARVANLSKSKAVADGLRLGAIRTGYKLPMAVAMGFSVAAGRKKSKSGETPSKLKKLMAPALGGAVIGALSRGGEGAAKDLLGGKGMTSALKGIVPKAAGGAAGGLVGGLVLGGVIDHAMKSLEKKGSAEELEKKASLASHLLALPLIHAATKGAMGYGNIGAATLRTRAGRALVGKMDNAKAKQLAIGIREGVAGRRNAGFRSGLFLNATVPELKLQREMGISIGELLRKLPEELRAPALQGASRMVRRNPASMTTPKGETVAVLGQLPKAVDMALGKKSLGGSKLLDSVLYSGRGGTGKGLPRAGRQDTKKSLDGSTMANWGSALGGTAALLGAGAMTGGAAIPAALVGGAGAHLGMGGWKSIIAKSDTVRKMSLGEAAKGIREAFLPGISKTTGQRVKDKLVDYGLSPGARDFGKMVGGVARGAAQAGRNAAGRASVQKYINRAATTNRKDFSSYAAPVAAAGLLGAGLGNLRKNKRDR